MEEVKLSWEQVKELLPDRVELNYIDYRDSLDENTNILLKCLRENSLHPLDEWLFDEPGMYDQQWESISYLKKELISDLVNRYDIEEDEAEELVDVEFDDEIRDYLYEHDESTPIEDLLRNTSDLIMFYDTGLEFDGYGRTPAEFRYDRMRLKKALQIRSSDYDKDIDMMMCQASYGGQLVIYFRVPVKDMITEKEFLSIQFTNPHIAIIDTCNGSGDDTYLKGHSIVLGFNRDNLFIDKEVKYNYSYDVCGMTENWCDETAVSFVDEPKEKIESSSINKHMEQEAKYNAVYKSGKCSFGDMDINRHRNTYYINNYPCGTKCKDCGTFWID